MGCVVMVFVPVSGAAALALQAGEPAGSLRGCAATPSLRAALGAGAGSAGVSEEEADFAALETAGVAGLDGLTGGRRLVLAADVADGQVEDQGSGAGEVRVTALSWAQVQALFADGEGLAAVVRAAAEAASGLPLAEALDHPAVVALGEASDLLWFAPGELADLL